MPVIHKKLRFIFNLVKFINMAESYDYLNLLKSRFNHCPDSVIQQRSRHIHALRTYVLSWLGALVKACEGRANARFFFLFFFFLRRVFSLFFPQEANKCFPFKIIYYFARYSCILCIMLLKPMLARSPRSFRN